MTRPTHSFYDENNEMRFIPVALPELIKGLLGEKPIQNTAERNAFARFSELLQAQYHTQYFENYRHLKHYYQPFNPDQDVASRERLSESGYASYQVKLFDHLKTLLKKANYDELNEELINESLTQELPRNLSIDVEMNDFEQVLFFVRGQGVQNNKKRDWRTLFLTFRTEKVVTYQRLCMAFKYQTEEALCQSLNKQGMNRFASWKCLQHHRDVVKTDVSQGYIYLRLFRDIPRSDVEKLFPNSTIHLSFLDKIKLSIMGGLGVLHYHHYKKFISHSLISHSLDIDVGVISSLIEQAREEEIKEALLAYYFIMRTDKKGIMKSLLDKKIETHLMMRYGVFLDFEVGDAVNKLKSSGLVSEGEDKRLYAVSLEEASTSVVSQWEDIFSVAKRISLLGKM